jgi:hypothetical protein
LTSRIDQNKLIDQMRLVLDAKYAVLKTGQIKHVITGLFRETVTTNGCWRSSYGEYERIPLRRNP